MLSPFQPTPTILLARPTILVPLPSLQTYHVNKTIYPCQIYKYTNINKDLALRNSALYLSIYLIVYLHLFMQLFVYLFIYPSISFIYLSIYLSNQHFSCFQRSKQTNIRTLCLGTHWSLGEENNNHSSLPHSLPPSLVS